MFNKCFSIFPFTRKTRDTIERTLAKFSWESHPRMVLMQLLSMPATLLTLGLWINRSIIITVKYLCRIGAHLFLQLNILSLLLLLIVMAYLLKGSFNRNVFNGCYSVVKELYSSVFLTLTLYSPFKLLIFDITLKIF